jgi:hypothetical protein
MQYNLNLVGGSETLTDSEPTYTCVKCKQVLPESKYRFRPERANYRVKECKDCSKLISAETHRIRMIAPPMPDACECCGKTTTALKLDHCHEHLTFRGWLCQSCNWGIGNLGDNLEGVMRALKYLERTNDETTT